MLQIEGLKFKELYLLPESDVRDANEVLAVIAGRHQVEGYYYFSGHDGITTLYFKTSIESLKRIRNAVDISYLIEDEELFNMLYGNSVWEEVNRKINLIITEHKGLFSDE